MEALNVFIKPELLILVPVLYLIGVMLKKNTQFQDKFIPLVLGINGILLSLLYLAWTVPLANVQDFLQFAFSGITQGILVAGASVYGNQMYKQGTKDE